MPSLYSLATLAFAFTAFSSSAFASEVDIAARALDLTDSIAAKHELSKRRVNHADEYGYPHGLPKYHNGKPMTPGGYKPPTKLVNHGWPHHGWPHPRPNPRPSGCSRHGHCSDAPANGRPICNNNKCTFVCNRGYYASGWRCIQSAPQCGRRSCPPVQDGFNTCSVRGRHIQCSPGCATYLGYQLYQNADGTAYRCINPQTDPMNCGRPGNVCKSGYNGKGYPTCSNGKCGLNCAGYGRVMWGRNGQQYCSSRG